MTALDVRAEIDGVPWSEWQPPQPRTELLWAAPVELIWAAGFYDGEGCTFVSHKKNVAHSDRPGGKLYDTVSVAMSVAQVDPRPLFRFATAVGGRKPGGPYKPRHPNAQPYYRWDAMGRPSVHRIIVLLAPYLSEPKKEQISRAWQQLHDLKKAKSPSLPALPEEWFS